MESPLDGLERACGELRGEGLRREVDYAAKPSRICLTDRMLSAQGEEKKTVPPIRP